MYVQYWSFKALLMYRYAGDKHLLKILGRGLLVYDQCKWPPIAPMYSVETSTYDEGWSPEGGFQIHSSVTVVLIRY